MDTKIAVIMGATSGIGREVARMLLLKGWKVGICGRRRDLLESLKCEFPRQVEVLEADVQDSGTAERLAGFVGRLGARLYLHCSGVGWQNPQLEEAKEMATLLTNGEGFVRCVGAVFRLFSSTGGHIAVISSIAGTKGLGPAPAYSATKRMQNTYIDALEQLACMRHLDINFTDIRPGFVRTALINGGKGYPMAMECGYAARRIVKAIEKKRRVEVIDWRYAVLVALWRCIPRFLWKRFPFPAAK